MLHKSDLALEKCDIKLARNSGRFEGYASVFDGVDSYGDTILRGAFAKTIAERKRPPLMLYGHNPGRVIGKWDHLEEDSKGLLVHGEFTPQHTDAMNVLASMRHGAIDGLSIGFHIPEGGSEKKSDGGRLIRETSLVEISVVTMPADDEARIHVVKQQIALIESLKDAEEILRDAGFSRSSARDLVSRIRTIARRDDGGMGEQIAKMEGLDGFLARLAALDGLIRT